MNEIRYNVTDTLNLTCKVDSRPAVKAVWQREESNMANVRRERASPTITYSYLVVPQLKRENTGVYACCIEGDASKCKRVQVIVQDRPSKPHSLEATFFARNRELNVSWEIEDHGGAELTALFIELTDQKANKTTNLSKI